MSTQPDDFEQLRRLLKLKRHEQPPPRFFNEFSGRVLTRLEQEEQPGFLARLWEMPWVEQMRGVLARNPISAGVFAVCGVLVFAISSSPYLDNLLGPGLEMANGAPVPAGLTPNGGNLGTLALAEQPTSSMVIASGTDPVFIPAMPGTQSLNAFGALAQPVLFNPGN